MRAAIIAVVALALAPAVARAELTVERTERLSSRLTDFTFSTPSFDFPARARVLLPAGYKRHPRRRYPVLYLLHGSFGNAPDWTENGDAEAITAGKPLIVVMPNTAGKAQAGGWASDWRNEGRGGVPKFETFTIGELLPWVDTRYRTRARREGRAIAGLSMGGFSAMSYGVRHPDLFAAAATFSGAVDTNYAPARPVIEGEALADGGATPDAIWGPRVTDEIVWRTHNPWDLAANLEAMTLGIRTGNGQPGPLDDEGAMPDVIEYGVHEMSLSLHDRLDALGIAHVYEDYGPGTHTWPYWQRDLRRELPRIMATFRHPPRRPSPFSYRTAEPRFSVYGWRVTRPDGGFAFAELARASRAGFDYTGETPATVVTGRLFRPGSRHTVTGAEPAAARATRHGRLRLTVAAGASVRFDP